MIRGGFRPPGKSKSVSFGVYVSYRFVGHADGRCENACLLAKHMDLVVSSTPPLDATRGVEWYATDLLEHDPEKHALGLRPDG